MQTRPLVLSAMFIALSFIGANLKVMGTVAFDSMPGFLGALFMGPAYGALIGTVGHFLTALLSGFPLSLPVHVIIMLDMAVTMAAFGSIYRRFDHGDSFSVAGAIIAGVIAVIINGPLALLVLTPLLLPVMGQGGMLAYLPILSIVAALNVLLAFIVYALIPNKVKILKFLKNHHGY